MNERRWVNPHQPQTLYMAVILCYIDAVFAFLSIPQLSPILILCGIGLGAGGYGIANEKKWGYAIAVAAAVLKLLIFFALGGLGQLNNVNVIISFAFDVLLAVLLLHPMSRDYQRIWFK